MPLLSAPMWISTMSIITSLSTLLHWTVRKISQLLGFYLAIRRMNDKLCLEHGLSIVENPKPSREHYGTWLGNKKQPSFQEQIRIAIDAALEEKPKDFEELLQKLETAGLEVNRERKHLRFRVPGQENYTRCDSSKAIIQNRPSKNELPVHGQ